MNENLDFTKILDGCPTGTEFYSNVWGKIFFEGTTGNPNDNFPIRFRDCKGGCIFLPKSGKYDYENAECIVFPSKDQRDWEKFERFWDKPKVEKFDPKTFHPYDKVLARGDKDTDWFATFFSHIDDCSKMAGCGYFICEQCIPYNEETKHLVGTSEDCPEHYKWWEE